jgi:hypothetical protein
MSPLACMIATARSRVNTTQAVGNAVLLHQHYVVHTAVVLNVIAGLEHIVRVNEWERTKIRTYSCCYMMKTSREFRRNSIAAV